MMPIRTAPPHRVCRLASVALAVLLSGYLAGRATAGPLPISGIDEFKTTLLQDRALSSDDPNAASVLVERRRELREAARRLPSLGEVTRTLLLPDWGSAFFEDIDTPVPIEKIAAAVRQPKDDDFKRDVQKLLKSAGDDSGRVVEAINAEIKREVRIQMLDRLEERLRFYLRTGRTADRIAAANLVSDTMSNARKQESADVSGISGTERRGPTEGSRSLRQRMAPLARDLQNLLRDPDPQVQVAAVRGLSNLESDPAATMAALRPLLQGAQSNVTLRRATAAGLAHMVDIVYQGMNKGRPQPTLRALGQIFPVAAGGLADTDAEVRRSSIAACQGVANTLDELVGDRNPALEGLAIYRPMLAIVEKTLPDLNRAARDPVPELRFDACHLLERLVLVAQKVRRLEETPLPLPRPIDPDTKPGKDRDKEPGKGIKGVKGASPSGRRIHRGTSRPSQWAAARGEEPMRTALPAPVPLSGPAASQQGTTLERPVKLIAVGHTASPPRSSPVAIHPAVFVAQPMEEPRIPSKLESGLRDTIDAMIAGMSDPDFRVRLASVDVLETFGDRAAPAIPALVKALEDKNKFVRWASARTLGRLAPRKAKEAVPGLMRLLNDREDLSVRITAANAIERFGPDAKEAVPLLARVINRGDKEYIIAVMHTLQGIGTEAQPALPNVAWILRNRALPSSVRVEAAQTLGRFGRFAKAQLPDLREIMVRDRDEDVRNAASSAVLAIDRPE